MDRINRTISILYRYGQRFLTARLRPVGVEVGQMPALMRVFQSPGITQEQITYETGMDKGTVARSVQQLEANGLVRREVDPADRRVNHIYATAKARALEPEVQRALEELHRALCRGLTEEEVAAAFGLLGRMKENLMEELARK